MSLLENQCVNVVYLMCAGCMCVVITIINPEERFGRGATLLHKMRNNDHDTEIKTTMRWDELLENQCICVNVVYLMCAGWCVRWRTLRIGNGGAKRSCPNPTNAETQACWRQDNKKESKKKKARRDLEEKKGTLEERRVEMCILARRYSLRCNEGAWWAAGRTVNSGRRAAG